MLMMAKTALIAAGRPDIIKIGSTEANTSGSSLIINAPAGVLPGDLLVAIMSGNGSITWTGDTGWTESIDQNATPGIRVAWKVAVAGEPSSYTFTPSGSKAVGAIVAYRNARFDTVGTIATNSTQTASAISLSSGGSALLAYFARTNTGITWPTPPSGMTAEQSDTAQASFALFSQMNLSGGSTGTRTAAPSAGTTNFGCLLVGIAPA